MPTTEHCPSCGSCGFPMRTADDFAGGSLDSKFCSTCADTSGRLKSFNIVVDANADYFVREQGVDKTAAREMARALLLSMPAWRPKE
jgi:Putative zinc ribbon domain